LLIGRVDQVQVRADARLFLPSDMQLAVIAPGKAKHTVSQRAAIDTSAMDGNDGSYSAYNAAALQSAEAEASEGDAALAAATYTPQPVIYSRAQWGANENIREKGSLHYFEVHAGFVHHTVNANNYTPDEVPGILRSIYAYHTAGRGWSDIGYNFLVDRFGRIWEGRYGGTTLPVVGAHTADHNSWTTGMSVIGNFGSRKSHARSPGHSSRAARRHRRVQKPADEHDRGRRRRRCQHQDAAAVRRPGQVDQRDIERQLLRPREQVRPCRVGALQ
jgi:hypothetical protein